MKLFILVLLTLSLPLVPAEGASFDCAQAKQPVEIAICAHPDLSQADEQLSAIYRTLMAKLSPPAGDKMRGVQRHFNKNMRDVCPSLPKDQLSYCVLGRIQSQTAMLQSLNAPGITLTVNGTFIPGKSKEGAIVEALWPEVDQPNAAAEKINSRIMQIVSRSVPDPGDRSYGLSFKINYASSKLFSVTFDSDYFPSPESPHALYDRMFVNFLPDKLREPTADDFFKDESKWKEFVEEKCMDNLKDSPFSVSVQDIETWVFTVEGVTIECTSDHPDNFYPASETFSWEELRPFLKSGAPVPSL